MTMREVYRTEKIKKLRVFANFKYPQPNEYFSILRILLKINELINMQDRFRVNFGQLLP